MSGAGSTSRVGFAWAAIVLVFALACLLRLFVGSVEIGVPSDRVKLAQRNGRPLLSALGFGVNAYCAENSMPESTAPDSAAMR